MNYYKCTKLSIHLGDIIRKLKIFERWSKNESSFDKLLFHLIPLHNSVVCISNDLFEQCSTTHEENHVSVGDSLVNIDDVQFIIEDGDSSNLKSVKRSASPEIIVDQQRFEKVVKMTEGDLPSSTSTASSFIDDLTPALSFKRSFSTISQSSAVVTKFPRTASPSPTAGGPLSPRITSPPPGSDQLDGNRDSPVTDSGLKHWIPEAETLNAINSIVDSDQAAEFSLIMNEAMSEVRLKSNRVIIRDENDIFGNLKLKISIRSIKITLIN